MNKFSLSSSSFVKDIGSTTGSSKFTMSKPEVKSSLVVDSSGSHSMSSGSFEENKISDEAKKEDDNNIQLTTKRMR